MIFKLKIRKLVKRILLVPVLVLVLVSAIILTAVGILWFDNTLHRTDQSYLGKEVGSSIAFIIPGLNEGEDKYKKIEGYYSDVGITPVFINVDWMKPSFKALIEGGCEEIGKVTSLYPNRKPYFFGFSFGAVIALSTAEKYQSKGTILCSLSPVFTDDLRNIPDWFKKIILPPSYKSLTQETTVFLYGDHDNSMIRRNEIVRLRKKIYSKSEFKMIEGAEHDITGEAYLKQIKQEIYQLKEDDENK